MHLVPGLALLMAGHGIWLVAMPALAAHGWLARPRRPLLLVVSGGGRFALPTEGRFDLGLSARSRVGGYWIELAFTDRPASRLLVLRDQLDALDWRSLRLRIDEATAAVCYNQQNFRVRNAVYQKDDDQFRDRVPR